MNPPPYSIPADLIGPFLPVVTALEATGVPYHIGGSVASSTWGFPRSTQDADIVADLQSAQIAPFVALLQDDFYLDVPAIETAVRQRGMFNLIHLESMFKVDIILPKRTAFAAAEAARAQATPLTGTPGQMVRLASPEDTILHKLQWYRQGGGVSERQWLDVLGVLKTQNTGLDRAYLEHWAIQLGVAELLTRAWGEAGLP
jgi:hypothetical protein